jgi:pimeloyl-ACP methyl ester carboxylesterase
MPDTVRSADGTTIAYERSGRGPALILIGGAFNDRRSADAHVPLLAPHFTVYAYDRRGRGDSTDTPPYAVEREVEDLAALVDASGGPAFVYGHSSGAVLALEAAARGVPVRKLAVHEPPYMVDDTREKPPADYAGRVQAAVDRGDRKEAAQIFLREAVGVPAAVVDTVEQWPDWPGMLSVAHTIPYDIAIVGDGSMPAARLATISVPTLAVDGGASPPWARNAVAAVAAAVPGAQRLTIEGQDHAVAPDALAPVLIEFFS